MEILSSWLEGLIKATAWEMTKPAPYGAFHLTFTFVGLAVSLFLAWRLRRLSDRGNRILLVSLGVVLLLAELYRQLFYYYEVGDGSYPWWIFPFQMCDVPMYFCMIAPWLRAGRLRKGMYSFMMLFNLLGGIMAFAEPSGIVHGYWTLTLHAFSWHMSLIFIGLYLAFSGRGGWERKDYFRAVTVFVILCAVAFCINVGLWDVSGGSVNMFFVGPRNSSLAVFSWIAERFGWYVSTLLYIPVVCLGAYLIYLPIHRCAKKKVHR